MYHDRVVLERDDSIRRMKLPLDLYVADEQAALGAWVLLEANIALPQLGPFADPNSRVAGRSGRVGEAIYSQSSPYCTDIIPSRVCRLFRCIVHIIGYVYRRLLYRYWRVSSSSIYARTAIAV